MSLQGRLKVAVVAAAASTCLASCAGKPLISTSAAAGVGSFSGTRIGITTFACADPAFGNAVADSFANEALSSGCRIVERSALSNLLQEQGIQAAGLTETLDASRIGALANVDYLVLGSVSVNSRFVVGKTRWNYTGTFQFVASASARVVDVKTGEVVRSVTYQPGRGAGWHQPNVIGSELAKAAALNQ